MRLDLLCLGNSAGAKAPSLFCCAFGTAEAMPCYRASVFSAQRELFCSLESLLSIFRYLWHD